jgi:hypothetical protein
MSIVGSLQTITAGLVIVWCVRTHWLLVYSFAAQPRSTEFNYRRWHQLTLTIVHAQYHLLAAHWNRRLKWQKSQLANFLLMSFFSMLCQSPGYSQLSSVYRRCLRPKSLQNSAELSRFSSFDSQWGSVCLPSLQTVKNDHTWTFCISELNAVVINEYWALYKKKPDYSNCILHVSLSQQSLICPFIKVFIHSSCKQKHNHSCLIKSSLVLTE